MQVPNIDDIARWLIPASDHDDDPKPANDMYPAGKGQLSNAAKGSGHVAVDAMPMAKVFQVCAKDLADRSKELTAEVRGRLPSREVAEVRHRVSRRR
jgi:hypothetical protein